MRPAAWTWRLRSAVWNVIRFKDLATGSDQTIAPINGAVYWGFTVSPDWHSFLYVQSLDHGTDLRLVENLR